MITIKNSAQIARMREAGAMLHEVLTQLRGKIQPGVTTHELDAYAEKLIRSFGAIPSFLNYEGYPASICASVDSQVVHGIPSKKTVLKEGQIISVDCGLILGGWQSDSAFTAPVGRISEEAQRLISQKRVSSRRSRSRTKETGSVISAMRFSSTSRSVDSPRFARCAAMALDGRCTRIPRCRTTAYRATACGFARG